jgi:hypothetical protein
MGFLSPSDWVSAFDSSAEDLANQQLALQRQMFDYQKETMAPWVKSGSENLARLNSAMREGGQLDPAQRYTTGMWQASPEYQAYNAAQQAAQTNAVNALQSQAGASGMYGSGNYANQLATNLGNLYAQYQPQSLAAAQQNWGNQRSQAYNMLAGLANPQAAQQISNYAGANAAQQAGILQNQFANQGVNRRGAANLSQGVGDLAQGVWNWYQGLGSGSGIGGANDLGSQALSAQYGSPAAADYSGPAGGWNS